MFTYSWRFRLTISLKINPSSLADGVILYAAQNHQGIGQFMSVTLKNRQVEFRYTVAGTLFIIIINTYFVKVFSAKKIITKREI